MNNPSGIAFYQKTIEQPDTDKMPLTDEIDQNSNLTLKKTLPRMMLGTIGIR